MTDRRPADAPLSEVRRHRRVDENRRTRRDRGYRWALLIGAGVSLLVHVALVLWISGELFIPRFEYESPPRPTPVLPEGLQVVTVEVPEAEEPAPTEPRPRRPPPSPEEPEEQPPPEEEEPAEGQPTPAPEAEEEGVTNAERLRPREGDGRLWREFWDEDLRGRYLGGSARADSAIRAILGRYFDSLRLSQEEYAEARDWTVGEGDERWGISPEGIHLGDITIPLPVDRLLSPTGPRRRELERELRELQEIQRQEAIGQAEETREERIDEMRKRSREEAADNDSASDSTRSEGRGD